MSEHYIYDIPMEIVLQKNILIWKAIERIGTLLLFSAKHFIKDEILYKEDYNFYEFLNIFGILDWSNQMNRMKFQRHFVFKAKPSLIFKYL